MRQPPFDGRRKLQGLLLRLQAPNLMLVPPPPLYNRSCWPGHPYHAIGPKAWAFSLVTHTVGPSPWQPQYGGSTTQASGTGLGSWIKGFAAHIELRLHSVSLWRFLWWPGAGGSLRVNRQMRPSCRCPGNLWTTIPEKTGRPVFNPAILSSQAPSVSIWTSAGRGLRNSPRNIQEGANFWVVCARAASITRRTPIA